MHRISLKWILSLLILLPGGVGNAQDQTLPVKEWITKLSVKNDPRSDLLTSVIWEILKFDSTYCEPIAVLEKQGPKRNKRFQCRIILLKATFSQQHGACPGWKTIEEMLKEGLQLAYEIDDQITIAVLNEALLAWYSSQLDYGSAGMHGLIAKEIQEHIGIEKFNYLAYNRYDLGFILYHSREYERSIEASRKAIFWQHQPGVSPGDSLNVPYKMYAWNTIGLCYKKLGKYDSAFVAFEHALDLFDQESNPFWYALIKGNEGDVYFEMGQYDSAGVLLQKDYEQSKLSGQFDNAANSLQKLARIHVSNGDSHLALKEVKEATQLLKQMPQPEFEANLLFAYTQVFKSLGNTDSVYAYMQRYLTLHDALEKEALENGAEIVNMRLKHQAFVNQIRTLHKEKQNITLIRNFGIGFILLLAGLAYVDFKRQNLKIKLQKQVAQERQRLAEIETENAREQLKEFTLNSVEKSLLIENLEQQLVNKEITAEQHQMIVELRHQQILTDADWDKFKFLFERVYPGFFISIKDKAPEITVAESRMAALIRLQLTTKESAALIGVSLDSIHKARQRLKQRLQLAPDAELDHMIATL